MTPQNIHHLPRLGIAGAMQLFGMTARALRFYEERGLVEARRDRLNARYYDGPARVRLHWISRLRRAGVGLAEIEDVLGAEDQDLAARALDIVEARRAAVAAELQAVEAVLQELRAEASPPAPKQRYGS